MRVVLTCEHGGYRVPSPQRALFAGARGVLASHRGWDPGALVMARALSRAWQAPLLANTTTRLLVDANRSPHNPGVFSQYTRGLDAETKATLLARHHVPHRQRVRAAVSRGSGRVLHVAVHSFTPVLRGEQRRFDIGLLYDPARRAEQELARAWQRRLRAQLPGAGVRRNAPYRGNADGLTTALRRERSERRYLGLELELNQRTLASRSGRRRLLAALAALPR